MPELRVGDFLARRKEAIHLRDDQEYRQVTISLNHGGIRLRGVKPGHEIGTKRQFLTRAGDFILSRIDARNAAFGIVPDDLDGAVITNDFWSFEIDPERVRLDYFYLLSQTDAFLDACIRSSSGTTNRQRIQEDFFLDYTFSVPPLDEQDSAVERYRSLRVPLSSIRVRLDEQAASTGVLRQRILDDAVRGRLTERDPSDEPAEALLTRIAAEKQRRFQAGEIRKPKPLPPVGADEAPFEVPAGWKWSRLGDVVDPARHISYGVLVPGPDLDDGVPFVRAQDLDVRNPSARPAKSIDPAVDAQYERTRLRGDELLLCVVGSIGKLGVAHPDWAGANIARAVCRVVPAEGIDRSYLLTLLQSPLIQDYFGSATRTLAQPTLNVSLINAALVSVPPLHEQRRIVARVDRLMALCDELEARLAAATQDAERLSQAVLAEALAA